MTPLPDPTRSALKSEAAGAEDLGVEGDPALERLFARYRVSVAAHRSERRTSALRTAEAVIEARVLLYEHLVSTGWDPPEEVRRQLEVDAHLAAQPPGELTG